MKSEAEHSIVGSYSIIKTVTGGSTDTFPTAFPFGASTTGGMNLLLPKYGGVADETRAYRIEILITGKPAGSATIQFTGIAPGGCEEPICSLACTVGAVVETGDWRWVDSITLTSWHLAEDNILRVDSGNSHPCKVGWDNIGYQTLMPYVTSLTTTTDIRIYARIL